MKTQEMKENKTMWIVELRLEPNRWMRLDWDFETASPADGGTEEDVMAEAIHIAASNYAVRLYEAELRVRWAQIGESK